MLAKIVKSAFSIHEGLTLPSLKRRGVFIYNALSNVKDVRPFLDRFDKLKNSDKVELFPHMLGVIEWPYIHDGWDMATKLDKVARHYEILSELSSPLISLKPGGSLEVMTLDAISAGVKVVLDRPQWFIHLGIIGRRHEFDQRKPFLCT